MRYFYSLYFFFLATIANGQILFDESAVNHGLIGSFGTGFVGGGISFVDFDNDGWDDVTLGTEEGEHIMFFKNLGGLFTQVFPNIVDDLGEHKQITWIDYDNDGDKDLYVAGYNYPNQLYRNDGGFSFTSVIVESGLLIVNQKNFGAAWGDYNNDGHIDVFLSMRSLNEANRLYKNNGDGTFTDVSSSSGISAEGHLSFCSSFIDYDKDGYQDIYIVNDRNVTTNIMYRNNGDGTFSDVSDSTGTGLRMDGMSTTIGDYNNDGWLDIYVTNTNEVYDEGEFGNVLLKNNGNGTFSNEALSTGTRFDSLAWGAVFLDAENDRDLDLYVSCMLPGPYPLPSAFYENSGQNTFEIPENAGFDDDTEESYSNAIGDLDNDGFPEIVVSNEVSNMFLWKNFSGLFTNNNWLKVKLEGVQSNRDALGSLIEVNTDSGSLFRYVTCGEGYISQNSTAEFFGLGSDSSINYVKVNWLSGVEDIILNVNPNQALTIIEGSTLSAEYNNFENFKTFPNPVKNILNFSKTQQPLQNISVFNMLGVEVMNWKYTEDNNYIDLSNLDSGSYLVRFEIERFFKVIHILKK